MEIRPLLDTDAAELRALRLRALLEEPDPFLSTHDEEVTRPVEYTAQRLRTAAAEERVMLGAFEADSLVGMVGFHREQRRKVRHRVDLVAMYVAPEARGRGHGRALVREVLTRAAAIPGVEQVHLMVTTT